jgi:hypothetical protein
MPNLSMPHLLMRHSLALTLICTSIVAASALTPLAITPAAAQSSNLVGATCADFMRLQPDDQRAMAVWLSGFYAGAAQRPTIDGAALRGAHSALTKFCKEKADAPLLGEATRDVINSRS